MSREETRRELPGRAINIFWSDIESLFKSLGANPSLTFFFFKGRKMLFFRQQIKK
jgi:hypothetical protein